VPAVVVKVQWQEATNVYTICEDTGASCIGNCMLHHMLAMINV